MSKGVTVDIIFEDTAKVMLSESLLFILLFFVTIFNSPYVKVNISQTRNHYIFNLKTLKFISLIFSKTYSIVKIPL
jgi:hypothetical protein